MSASTSAELSASKEVHVPGRLVFDDTLDADADVVAKLYDELFPPVQEQRKKSIPSQPSSCETADFSSESTQTACKSVLPPRSDDPTSCPVEDSAFVSSGFSASETSAEFPPDILRVVERRRETLARFRDQQEAGLELRRRSGQPLGAVASGWSPPMALYRPPPLRALQRQLLEPGELADTVLEPTCRATEQIQQFADHHGLVEEPTPRYRRNHTDSDRSTSAG